MPHKWNHDPTNGGQYQPKVCGGRAHINADVDPVNCAMCGRHANIHDGTPFSDHSQCMLTCEACGEKHPCNKLYPENKECSGTKEINQ